VTDSLLYIETSPRGHESFSARLGAAFLEAYAQAHPRDTVSRLNLFEHLLPDFDREAAAQKMQQAMSIMHKTPLLGPIGKWAAIEREIDRLKAADKVVISTPMWNFSIPYKLKHYIDIVVQPGSTFSFTPDGKYFGLLENKKLQLILVSGSEYAMRFPLLDDGTKTDYQRPYLEHMARFIGFEDIRVLKMQPTAAGTAETIAAAFDKALAEAKLAGRNF
jgi:FMN-dependent NADH-azoreductase